MVTIEISCVEVWREISNYIEGDVSPELRARIEAHFKTCKHCTAVHDGTRNVVRLIGDGHTFEVPTGFSTRLYNKLPKRDS
jgi:predicted anti-sigma-YlaC factor YlaD